MNQRTKAKTREHYSNYMTISKVLSLLKTLPCDTVEDIKDINCTRRMLDKLQTQEYEKDMSIFNEVKTVVEKADPDWRLKANIIGASFGGTGAI